MSRRVYSNGVLLEEWDDATLTYRRFVNGEVVEERSYTAPEVAAIVGAGAVVITDRQMVVLDDDGSEIFRIGDMQWGDRGFLFRRENGQLAISMNKAFSSSTYQALTLRDASGYSLLEEEALGVGLGKPYLPIPVLPVTSTTTTGSLGPWGPQVAVSSGSFVTTHQGWFVRTNRWAMFRIQVAASDTTTSGEVQVVDSSTGLPLAGFLQSPWLGTRATGSTSYVELVAGSGSVSLPGNPHERISIAIQARRTAGAGTLTVAVPEAHGWSP